MMKKRGTVMLVLGGAFVLGGVIRNIYNRICAKDAMNRKLSMYYDILNCWLELKQRGDSIETWFLDNGYKAIAIYGMGDLGKHLYDELKDTGVNVKYGIEGATNGWYLDLEIKPLDEKLKRADVIVVTPVFAFDEIKRKLGEKVDCPIISLHDIFV